MLLTARTRRVPPGRDDKILTSWNALAIRGLADAARALDDAATSPTAAARSLAYLRQVHWRDGRLLAASRDGKAQLPAYLDDHALLIDAILALLTVRFDASALAFAAQLADALLERFEDREHGGFFFTASDHETLIHRSRSFSDDAMPSGNAIAAQALQKLGWLLGEPRYLIAPSARCGPPGRNWRESPLGLHAHGQCAGRSAADRTRFVILRGEQPAIDAWRRELQRVWQPLVSIIAIPAAELGPARGARREGSAMVRRVPTCAAAAPARRRCTTWRPCARRCRRSRALVGLDRLDGDQQLHVHLEAEVLAVVDAEGIAAEGGRGIGAAGFLARSSGSACTGSC